jgi:hypothetical protein
MATNSSGRHEPPALPAFTHPALNDWAITREIDKLEQSYGSDQRHKPSAGRLKQYAEAVEAVFYREIRCGRFANTPDLWAAVYSQKILPSVCAKINALLGNEAMRLFRIGGGKSWEQATFEKAQRECSRIRAGLEGKLNQAIASAKEIEYQQELVERADANKAKQVFAPLDEVAAGVYANCSDASYRDPAKAIALINHAIALDVEHPTYLTVLALAYFRSGKLEKAVETQRQALESPRFPRAYREEATTQLREYEKALAAHNH